MRLLIPTPYDQPGWVRLLEEIERHHLMGWPTLESIPLPGLAEVICSLRFRALATLYNRLAAQMYGQTPFVHLLFDDCPNDPMLLAWNKALTDGEETAIRWAATKVALTYI